MSDIEKLDYIKTLPGIDDLECELNGIKMKFSEMYKLMEKDIEIERQKELNKIEMKSKLNTKIKIKEYERKKKEITKKI